MKQTPSNLKYKKYHKPNINVFNLVTQNSFLPMFGFWGLQSLDACRITFNQLEAARRSIRRTTKKSGRLWINLFTNFSITKKAVGSRMGNGKGAISHWVCPVRKGQILYELSGVRGDLAIRALLNAGSKLPVKTKVVKLIY